MGFPDKYWSWVCPSFSSSILWPGVKPVFPVLQAGILALSHLEMNIILTTLIYFILKTLRFTICGCHKKVKLTLSGIKLFHLDIIICLVFSFKWECKIKRHSCFSCTECIRRLFSEGCSNLPLLAIHWNTDLLHSYEHWTFCHVSWSIGWSFLSCSKSLLLSFPL